MKKIIRKLMVVGFAVSMLLSVIPQNHVQAANTNGSFEERIGQLQKKFPSGKYWNHAGSAANNPNGYTSTPCSHHGHCSAKGYNGWCGCNSFNNQSIQCFGFSEKLAYDVFGTNPSRTWIKSYSISNVKAGDIIRYKNNGHSIFVTRVSGNTITYADCNSDGHCKIRWNVNIDKSAVWGLSYIQHANNYNDVMSISSDRTNPTMSDAKIESADANGYTISAKVSDNVGITTVRCATWTSGNGQDDLIWKDMALNGNTAKLYVKFAEHGNQVDYYNNHIYAYDAAGNYSMLAREYDRCENIGTGFYSKITNIELKKVIANKGGNAVSVSDGERAECLWKFERQSDGSYKIISCQDGTVLDVTNFQTANRTNVLSYGSNNGRNQRWFISKNAGGYSLMPACAPGKALDVYGKSAKEEANVVIFDWGYGDGAEVFRFDRIADVSKYYGSIKEFNLYNNAELKTAVNEIEVGGTLYFKVECKNASCFRFKMYKNGRLIMEKTVPAGSYKYSNLLEGSYYMEFMPENQLSSAVGKVTKTFLVKKIEAKNDKVEAPMVQQQKVTGFQVKSAGVNKITLSWNKVQGAAGYEIYRYSGKSSKAAARIAVRKGSTTAVTDKRLKKAAAYKYRIRPWFLERGKKVYGEFSELLTTYTVLSAPKVQIVKSRMLRQTGVLWNKVKEASGYEIYRSNNKNGTYQKIASISKNKAINSYRDKRLTRKRIYYYKVRAYTIIDGKRVYSTYSNIKSAQM